jgi:RNA polymerase sigma-70 factor (ECF subfamily)
MDLAARLEAERPALFRYALAVTRNRDEAEDLTQDTLRLAWTHIKTFNGLTMQPWLLRICRNQFINKVRIAKRRGSTGSLEDIPYGEEPSASMQDVAGRLSFDEELAKVRHLLNPQQVDAVLLHEIDQLSYEEIAVIQNAPLNTIRTRIHRGRDLLRPIAKQTLAA